MKASCRCGAVWHQAGSETAHCGGCHRTFSSVSAFDRHRVSKDGVRVCLDPGAVTRGNTAAFSSCQDRYGCQVWQRCEMSRVTASSGIPEETAA